MINAEKMFGNLLDEIEFIPSRKYNFAGDLIGKLTAANGAGEYTVLIDLLTPPTDNFGVDIGLLDVSLGGRKSLRLSNDQVEAAFKLTMSVKRGVIAEAVGGVGSPSYNECYTHGGTEFANAAKKDMVLLTGRVYSFAGAQTGLLGGPLTTLLQSFQSLWAGSTSEFVLQKGVVNVERTGQFTTELALDLAICTVIHTIAAKFPGEVATCSAFFNFGMLSPVAHHLHNLQSGTAANPFGIKMVLNRLLTDNVKLIFKNTTLNSDMLAYLAPTATSLPEAGQGVIIKANHGKHPMPHELGDLANPFLIIQCLSDVNPVNFIAEIIG